MKKTTKTEHIVRASIALPRYIKVLAYVGARRDPRLDAYWRAMFLAAGKRTIDTSYSFGNGRPVRLEAFWGFATDEDARLAVVRLRESGARASVRAVRERPVVKVVREKPRPAARRKTKRGAL